MNSSAFASGQSTNQPTCEKDMQSLFIANLLQNLGIISQNALTEETWSWPISDTVRGGSHTRNSAS